MRVHELFFCFLGLCVVGVLVAIPYGFLASNSPPRPSGIEYKDLVAIQLAAVTVLVGVLGVGIAVLTVWGYREFMNRADQTAKEVANTTVNAHLGSDSFKNYVREMLGELEAERTAAAVTPEPEQQAVGGANVPQAFPEPPPSGLTE